MLITFLVIYVPCIALNVILVIALISAQNESGVMEISTRLNGNYNMLHGPEKV